MKQKKNYKADQKLTYSMYCDGSLDSAEAIVIYDDGKTVCFKYFHPLYPEAGYQFKTVSKKDKNLRAS